jgi:hypothetical protein
VGIIGINLPHALAFGLQIVAGSSQSVISLSMSRIDTAPALMASLPATMSSLALVARGDPLLGTRVRTFPSIDIGTVSVVDTGDSATSFFSPV